MPDSLLKNKEGGWDTGKVALIFTMLIQLVASIWWTSKLDSRVGILELQVVNNTTSIVRLDLARETAALAQTKSVDKQSQMFDMLKALINRSTSLHPEFQDDNTTKSPR